MERFDYDKFTPPQRALFERCVARGSMVLPLWREVNDVDYASTISLYHHLRQGQHTFLFESAHTDSPSGRYSLLGLRCTPKFVWQNGVFTDAGESIPEAINPLEHCMGYVKSHLLPSDWPLPIPLLGSGLFGYFGYDTCSLIEPVLKSRHQEQIDLLRIPDIFLMAAQELILIDHKLGLLYAVVTADIDAGDTWDSAMADLERLCERVKAVGNRALDPLIPPDRPMEEEAFVSYIGEEDFIDGVETIKGKIRAGDAFQVVLAQHMSAPFESDPLELYRALRAVSPTPYMYFLDLGEFQLCGASPETLCKLDQGSNQVSVRPIAGTRRRGRTPAEDLILEQELTTDPKEIAEHVMLVDLGRNDIGRIAKIGSVKVEEYLQVERFRQVMHLVSTVTGALDADKNAMDLLKSTFPAGTLSGAPKIAAMNIINSLEPYKRGAYGGGVGYLGFDGSIDLAICIRTAVIKNEFVYVTAGGGVVADSVPKLEWKESLNKARSIFRAVQRVESEKSNRQSLIKDE